MTGHSHAGALGAGLCAVALAVTFSSCSSSGGGQATGGSTASGPATPGPGSGASGTAGGAAVQQAFVTVIQKTLPSVVEIQTNSGLGSGIILDTGGDIVTNAHVVGSSRTFTVHLANSTKTLDAKLVGTYPPDDLAVIKASGGENLLPASFADSAAARVGDIVLAMGNPLGLSSSVTDGIISATGRTVSEPSTGSGTQATLPDVIQTSAAINPGNSGGALVNLDGKVVGIPTLAALQPSEQGGTSGAAPGIGFAIPSNIATDIAGQLVKNGRVVNSHRAAIGARVVTVAGASGEPAGVGVDSVTPGGPADMAGIGADDVITSVNGQTTPDTATLAAVLAGLQPGQKVPVKVTRPNGTPETVTVTLGQLPG